MPIFIYKSGKATRSDMRSTELNPNMKKKNTELQDSIFYLILSKTGFIKRNNF